MTILNTVCYGFQKSSVRASLRRARAGAALSPPRAGMERLRRSFRESFRRRKGSPPESARPHQWHADEAAVRAGTCTFPVKYLGCVEVFESRGMQVCEEALKVLRVSFNLFIAGPRVSEPYPERQLKDT